MLSLGVFTLPKTRYLGERLNWLGPVQFHYDDWIFVEQNLSMHLGESKSDMDIGTRLHVNVLKSHRDHKRHLLLCI